MTIEIFQVGDDTTSDVRHFIRHQTKKYRIMTDRIGLECVFEYANGKEISSLPLNEFAKDINERWRDFIPELLAFTSYRIKQIETKRIEWEKAKTKLRDHPSNCAPFYPQKVLQLENAYNKIAKSHKLNGAATAYVKNQDGRNPVPDATDNEEDEEDEEDIEETKQGEDEDEEETKQDNEADGSEDSAAVAEVVSLLDGVAETEESEEVLEPEPEMRSSKRKHSQLDITATLQSMNEQREDHDKEISKLEGELSKHQKQTKDDETQIKKLKEDLEQAEARQKRSIVAIGTTEAQLKKIKSNQKKVNSDINHLQEAQEILSKYRVEKQSIGLTSLPLIFPR